MATIAPALEVAASKEEQVVVRFDIHQRIQHILMMSSFIILALTGLPLKFHDLAVSQWWIGLWGGIETTRTLHRFFAYVMVFDCVYHAAYIAFSTLVLKRPFPLHMIPSLKDVMDLVQDIKYYLRLSRGRARYERFNYREKFDYWAIFWGIPIMAGSGFILMFPVLTSKYLPNWSIPVAYIAHSDEAVLAVVWIFIVHIFFSHFTRHVFPVNTSIFTGKVPVERYRIEHPLEYERMTQPEKKEEEKDERNT